MPSGQARANPRPGLPQESDRERCPGLLLSRPLAPCAPLPLFDRVRKGCSRRFLSATPCRRKAGGTSPGATAQVLGCGCLVLKHFACTRSARMAVTWGGAPAVLGRTVTKRTTLCQGQGGSSGSSSGMRQGDGGGGESLGHSLRCLCLPGKGTASKDSQLQVSTVWLSQFCGYCGSHLWCHSWSTTLVLTPGKR